ncbi:hypothetical protein J3R30DRAFT_3403144 [Lentinula aciculospora]|uniref:Uncharacterized protein n=1 Tax=Lentinula aciculospora TaxID=153920 RepID=A0A9W9AFR2_9AGAR|nr:hypothetical protein J3R30DRAFT_3403144 [Lentinula aciculospora]
MDNLDVNIPNPVEEPNPFVANAQFFVPYSESILALGGHRRNNVFCPTTLISLPTLEVISEFMIGGTADTLNFDIQTLYTASGITVQMVRKLWEKPKNQPIHKDWVVVVLMEVALEVREVLVDQVVEGQEDLVALEDLFLH